MCLTLSCWAGLLGIEAATCICDVLFLQLVGVRLWIALRLILSCWAGLLGIEAATRDCFLAFSAEGKVGRVKWYGSNHGMYSGLTRSFLIFNCHCGYAWHGCFFLISNLVFSLPLWFLHGRRCE